VTVRAQDIVEEALSWVGTPGSAADTPWAHQQALKGVCADCAGYVSEVVKATGMAPDVEFEKNYRRREDGQTMLAEVVRYAEPVASFSEVRPADIIFFHDGRKTDEPRHMAFVTRTAPYVKMAHASERGVRHHRIDGHLQTLIHSIWRRPNLIYDE
jgi:cell wall-associated NlpC family hydrolase